MSSHYTSIQELEERLRSAQIDSDVRALDELISDDLQFVLFDGSMATKQMDLDSHRSGQFKIHSLDLSEQEIRDFGDTQIVTVKAKVSASQVGQYFSGEYRYSRTWHRIGNRWQIIAGCVTVISK